MVVAAVAVIPKGRDTQRGQFTVHTMGDLISVIE